LGILDRIPMPTVDHNTVLTGLAGAGGGDESEVAAVR